MRLENSKLLIVDDEVDLCQVLAWEFEDHGVDVVMASSGNAAKEELKKNKFDIILSDIKMPNGDGIDLLNYIFDNSINIKAFYFMTGYSDYPEEKLLEKGMTKLFRKPINIDGIVADIKDLD